MLPSEMIILMATVVNPKTGNKLLTSTMDVTGEYIGYLYNSLVNRGYLKYHGPSRYQLTVIGREAISDFIRKNKTKSKDIIIRLKMLGIEISPEQEHKIEKLGKESIKAN
ncbi:MAG: hypothetical protein JXA51_02920 [Dehalococcoidales bacterium]|nr:hypothetical protein [Dehalococcoidales bacterium]